MTEPYHTDNLVTVHHGDCLQHLRNLPDNSIDSIVTDPPYGLSNTGPDKVADTIVRWAGGERDHVPEGRGFMGRPWDAFVPPPAVWDECLRVLKPGGHMLVFAGSRTQDLMGLSIRLAGFELRDSLAWIYGCLSEDSEALTRRGWVRGPELRDDDEVMQWDHTTGRLSWTTPQRIIVKPWQGRMVRLANRHTDQLLTPDHRVYAQVRRHSRNPAPEAYEVVEAQDLRPSWQVTLPMAGTLDGGEDVDPDLAYLVGWWLTDAWRHGDGKAVMFSQSKPETLEKLRTALEPHGPSEYIKTPRCDRHNPEHTFYVTGDLAARLIEGWPDRHLGWDVLGWSLEARTRLLDGLVDGDGSRKDGQHGVAFWSKKQDRLDIVTALFLSVGWRAYADPAKGVVYANLSPTTQVQKRHRDAATDVEYEGLVWCVTVPTGAFVARRNNRPFITGNSGFPKSMDVSKAIDKAAGVEREVVGRYQSPDGRDRAAASNAVGTVYGRDGREWNKPLTAPATSDAARWAGWGTALKPSHEPILCARKPLTGTVAANVLEWGTGALNIDACRVGTEQVKINNYSDHNVGITNLDGKSQAGKVYESKVSSGRWPANVLLDPEAAEAMDEQSGHLPGGGFPGARNSDKFGTTYGDFQGRTDLVARKMDSGGASRFFPVFKYQAKAPKKERPVIERPPMLQLRDDLTPEQVDHVRARLAEAGVQVD